MKLLFVSSKNIDKSPTFIKRQVDCLRPDAMLYGGYRPYLCNGVSIFPFPVHFNIVRIFLKRIVAFLYARIYKKALTAFIKKGNFDVVLCQFGPQGANIADSCDAAGVPLVVHFHGYDAFLHQTVKEYGMAYRNMFAKAARIIAVSEDMRKQLIHLGSTAEQVILRPCGVDTTLFDSAKPADSAKLLLFVGRFTAKKDPTSLLKAFQRAQQEVQDARLVMIGKGELHQLVLKTVKELHIENSVTVIGWQKPEEVSKWMQQARAYVQHSVFAPNGDSEGSPVAIIEAAGSGLPVVSTRHAGIKESVIHGVTGFLVDEGDWQTMSEYMVKLLRDPELAGQMGAAARQHILANYDVALQMQTLKQTLEQVMTENAR